jgi:hypothetical protein
VLKNYTKAEHARRLAVVNRDDRILDERTPLLSSTEASLNLSRREIIRNNFAALATIALSLVCSSQMPYFQELHLNFMETIIVQPLPILTSPQASRFLTPLLTPTHQPLYNTSACE